MARVAAAVMCMLVLCASMAAPAVASRKLCKGAISAAVRALCIPATESLLTVHEGKHECAYNLSSGHRAVGVGYDLDVDTDTRRSELSTVLADYDKVYEAKSCLNAIQVSALLAFDAKRDLDRAARNVKSLDEQCCDVMAVFADIQHSGGKDVYAGNDLESFVEAVSAKKWRKAVKKLERTEWCSDHQERCLENMGIVAKGCGNSIASAAIARIVNLAA